MAGPYEEHALTPEEVKLLAALADLKVPEHRLVSIANRLQALRDGAAIVDALPLREVEPAAVFRLVNQSD